MRYMRGLNDWLARDVHDRQNELRGVIARVDALGYDLQGTVVQMNPKNDLTANCSSASSFQYIFKPGQHSTLSGCVRAIPR
jgi:hypothetical protein